jgi:hypothetical protein
LAHDLLGMQYEGPYEGEEGHCIDLGLPPPPDPPEPFVSFYRDDPEYALSVVGTYADTDDAFGSLVYLDGPDQYTEFAAVRRDNTSHGNWRSVVTGLTFYRLCVPGCGGTPPDTTETLEGITAFLGREIEWILEDSGQPLDPWAYPCLPASDVADDHEPHLTGAVNYLYAAKPNPFTRRADIRFRLASRGKVRLQIYDVSGRLVRALVDEALAAGEHAVVWDGLDAGGRQAESGVYWMQMETHDGYRSCKNIITLR